MSRLKIFCILLVQILSSVVFSSVVMAQKKRPKNIILMIGDGMGAAQVYAGYTANHGQLNLARCTSVGFHTNQASDAYVTDSGAGATALAIGAKTYNGAIGVDATRTALPTILEIAEKNSLATGMVVSCSITHATPASFIAHQPSRSMVEEIAADFLKTDIDVFIGGGKKDFASRKDGRNLLDSLKVRGYQVLDTLPEIVKVKSGKLAGFIANGEPKKVSEGRGDQLLQSTQTALQLLTQNKNGFFMMVEGSQIDWGGHANDTKYVTDEMIDFDKAIGAVLDFAEKDGNTLVIITADHETGGMALVGGDITSGKVEAKFNTGGHTGIMIPVFAFGPGAPGFAGIYPNNTIFDKMMKAFRFSEKNK